MHGELCVVPISANGELLNTIILIKTIYTIIRDVEPGFQIYDDIVQYARACGYLIIITVLNNNALFTDQKLWRSRSTEIWT